MCSPDLRLDRIAASQCVALDFHGFGEDKPGLLHVTALDELSGKNAYVLDALLLLLAPLVLMLFTLRVLAAFGERNHTLRAIGGVLNNHGLRLRRRSESFHAVTRF